MAAGNDEAVTGKDKFWEELTTREQDAVRKLGWAQATWDDGDSKPMEGKYWNRQKGDGESNELTKEEKEWATILGHTAATWDHGMSENDAATLIQAKTREKLARRRKQQERARASCRDLASCRANGY